VLILLGLALLIRLAYLYQYQLLPDWNQLTVDNYYHIHWALNIADGNILGDTTYFRAPFYVYCLAVLYTLLGSSIWIARLFGVAAGLGSIVLTYLLGKRMFSHKVGLSAAAVYSVFPTVIYFETELLLDPLFTFLLLLSAYLFMLWLDSGLKRFSFLSGLFLGLAAITRPTALVLFPILLPAVFILRKPVSRRYKTAALFIVGTTLVVTPIFIRNCIIASDPVLIASQGGINFYIGNNDSADGISAVMPAPLGHNWRLEDVTHIAERERGRELRPGEVSTFWFERGMRWIRNNPLMFAGLFLKKLHYNFSNREVSNNRSLPSFFTRIPILRYNPLSFGLIFPLAVVGAAFAFRRSVKVKLLCLILIGYVLLTALFFFNSRFRLPLIPYYVILATFAVFALTDVIPKGWKRSLPPLVALLLLGAFSFAPVAPIAKAVSTQDLLSKGLMFMNNEEYDTAISYYRQALAYDESFPTTNLNLGICFLRIGNADSALYYFAREKRYHPLRSEAYTNIASFHLVNGRYHEAMDEIRQALKLKPYDVTANIILIRTAAYSDSIRPDSLCAIVRQSAMQTERDLFVLNEAAAALLSHGLTDIADSILRQALITEPPPIETDNTAFDAHHKYGSPAFEREKAQTYYRLGFLMGKQGRYEESIEYSREAVRCDPDLVEAYINLFSGYLSQGRVDRADSVLAVVMSRFPDHERVRELRKALISQ
jgi:4-amino-4-deoxy-L-arabinose transferase-like glycosyltransferase